MQGFLIWGAVHRWGRSVLWLEAPAREDLRRPLLRCDGTGDPRRAHRHEPSELRRLRGRSTVGDLARHRNVVDRTRPSGFRHLHAHLRNHHRCRHSQPRPTRQVGHARRNLVPDRDHTRGVEEVPNLVLAAGMAFLLTQDFPTDVWTMLRGHRRPPAHDRSTRGHLAPCTRSRSRDDDASC